MTDPNIVETLVPEPGAVSNTIAADGPSNWEIALEEAINRFEQGETLTEESFADLLAELEQRHAQYLHSESDNETGLRLEGLKARAAKLEASAALGTGPTDQVSSMLAPLTGSAGKP